MRIAVYCSSSEQIDSKYNEQAFELGVEIASRGWDLVTGGGQFSSMGAVSKGARSKGGHTIGVIPQRLVDIEYADHGSDELHIVDSMRTRKAMMEDLSDAFITLPGGAGTLEEFFEIWVGRYLAFHDKPVIILDSFGIYKPLKDLVRHLGEEKFLRPGQTDILHWTTSIPEAMAVIESHKNN
jgi:uncharacterized protein (TIGR00730 family)